MDVFFEGKSSLAHNKKKGCRLFKQNLEEQEL